MSHANLDINLFELPLDGVSCVAALSHILQAPLVTIAHESLQAPRRVALPKGALARASSRVGQVVAKGAWQCLRHVGKMAG